MSGQGVVHLHGLGDVEVWMQFDLAGSTDFEVYLEDRLLYAQAVRYDEVIHVDEYADFDGLSWVQGMRILGAVAHETVGVFGDLTAPSSPAQRSGWCKAGCRVVGGTAGAAVGGAVIAGCLGLIKKPAICKALGAGIGLAVAGAIVDECVEQFCD